MNLCVEDVRGVLVPSPRCALWLISPAISIYIDGTLVQLTNLWGIPPSNPECPPYPLEKLCFQYWKGNIVHCHMIAAFEIRVKNEVVHQIIRSDFQLVR